jgi:hypothetical protein
MSGDLLEGSWFSTSDLKLAVSLYAAGFAFREQSECTRLKLADGRESFTWHFHGFNRDGVSVGEFLKVWEEPAPETLARPDAMTCFFLAREIMFSRTHIVSESHRVPNHVLLKRGDKRLIVSARLGKKERDQLAHLAS